MTDKLERYLGDGVYASFDGYHIWLDLRAQDPKIRIALEPPVFKALIAFQEEAFWSYHSDRQAKEKTDD